MSDQSPTASGKDQFPHTDVANNEDAGTAKHEDAGTSKTDKRRPAESRRTPGAAEGERDQDEQSR